MVIFVDKVASINIKMISYLNLWGVSIFSEGTVFPNPHTDFENSDKIRLHQILSATIMKNLQLDLLLSSNIV